MVVQYFIKTYAKLKNFEAFINFKMSLSKQLSFKQKSCYFFIILRILFLNY